MCLYLEEGDVEESGELVEELEDDYLQDVAPLELSLRPRQLELGQLRSQPSIQLQKHTFQ